MKIIASLLVATFAFAPMCFAASPSDLLNKPAPTFELKNQKNEIIKLTDRKDKGWTALFFYPKAGTPGCTKQACAFRDSIKVIKKLNTEVYGISTDSVADQKEFHEEQKLTFDLLSDADAKTAKSYNVTILLNMTKRTTFIIDDKLVVRKVLEDVDPAVDAKNVAQTIEELQKKPKS
jgi:peroxiredoxin Q/BCP